MKVRSGVPLLTVRAKFPVYGNTGGLGEKFVFFAHSLPGLVRSVGSKFWCPSFSDGVSQFRTTSLPSFLSHIRKVFCLRGRKEVVRVHAPLVVATVANKRPWGNCPVNRKKHCFVGIDVFPIKPSVPISGATNSPGPLPAPALLFSDMRTETVKKSNIFHGKNITQHGTKYKTLFGVI